MDLLQRADMLSELHDDVLLNILERVGMLDAVRACAVSKRMLKLPAMLSKIIIVLSAHELVQKNGIVADAVDKILSMRSRREPIRKLKLKFIMRGDDHLRIGRSLALDMAMQKINAAEFEILAAKVCYHCNCQDMLHFTTQFNAFIGECPEAFAGLTRLHLQLLRFDEPDILPNILSTCKRLESLHLFVCATKTGSVLQVEHARLVELDINYGLFETVELNSLPNLQRMTYHKWCPNENPLLLGFVPRLSTLSLTNIGSSVMALKLSHLLVNAPSIKDLHLDFRSEKIWIQPECKKLLASSHGKLRLVNLDNLPGQCDITWTLFFLEAAPSLEELCITVCDHRCQRKSQQSYSKKTDVKWEPYDADFKHKNLAKLTIHGFESDDNFMRYVRRIMEVATNISEISLHDRKVCKVCIDKSSDFKVHPTRYPRTGQEKNLVRKNITETFVAASPSLILFRPSCYYSPLVIERM